MFGAGRYHLGNFGPVPVYLAADAVLLLLFGVLQYQGSDAAHITIGVIALALTILFHEMGHAAMAVARGMRGVAIVIGGFGGFCSYVGGRRPTDEFLISLAGPAVNFAIWGGCSWLLAHGIHDAPTAFFVKQMWMWNLVLGIFNILPIYPLDGGQASLALARLVTSEATARRTVLTLSVAAAVIAVGVLGWLNQGVPPVFTVVILALLLMQAFTDLRR